jgi:hypothetical protein
LTNVFLLFCSDHRASIKAARPELKVQEIMKELGAQWKTLDTAAKQKYIDQAAPFKAPKKVYYF